MAQAYGNAHQKSAVNICDGFKLTKPPAINGEGALACMGRPEVYCKASYQVEMVTSHHMEVLSCAGSKAKVPQLPMQHPLRLGNPVLFHGVFCFCKAALGTQLDVAQSD